VGPHSVLSLLGTRRFQIHLSVPLVLEDEEVLRGQIQDLGLTETDISDVLDYMCRVGDLHAIHFLWRPRLKDPDDEMVLECAVEAGCDCIVTYNKADVQCVEPFGNELVVAQELRQQIGALS